MKFQNHLRNEYGKCDLPSNTLQRIREGFLRLNLDVTYAPVRVAENLHWGRIWIDSLRIICEGKGVTPDLAEASAYAELAERLSGGMFYPVFEEQVRFNIPALYNRTASRFLGFEWLPGYIRAHQNELQNPLRIEDLLVNETQLEKKDVEEIKDSRMAENWVDGYSLLEKKKIKVPINFVAYIHGSNGMAAGNTLEEAVIQASCEIFERHVQIGTIKNEMIVPNIDPQSVDVPLIREMIDFFERKNVSIKIKDLSMSDLFPVVGVLYTNKNLPPDRMEHRIMIPGASFTKGEGLTRCFTEGMQGRKSFSAPREQLDRPVIPSSRVANLYLLMRCGVSPKDISFLEQGETKQYKRVKTSDGLLGEIESLKSICSRLNTDCIVVNQTHPVLDFPVVRVIIPGVSDFLPFLNPDILIAKDTKPSSTWRGEEFMGIMESFFSENGK